MEKITGGITAAKGFSATSCEANIKYKDRTDMALVYSESPCECAGTFTSNVVKAACVQWDMQIVESGKPMHAVVVNSGIANACTGKEGFDACEATAKAVEKTLGVPFDSVAVASTGVIGMQLPVEKLVAGVEKMSKTLDASIEAGTAASKAIMTTDTVNKEVAVTFMVGDKKVTLGGMSKGSGMIHPNMCTMLGFLTTDINISKELLVEALKEDVVDTFNMISVDGDTSTNDTLLIMANGQAGNEKIISKDDENYKKFKEALHEVNQTLAMKMAGDGEGATALFECQVVNAKTKQEARVLAKSVICSSLVKAAVYGHDANWGRILCALGYSGVQFDPLKVDLYLKSKAGEIATYIQGSPVEVDEEKATKILSEEYVTAYVDMHDGDQKATAWGCDLTHEYVNINADYRS